MVSSGRGMLCESVINKSKEFLGVEITQKELRLYPYLDYVWKNGGLVNINKLDDEEMNIIETRISEGHIKDYYDIIYPTREFYDYVQDILADTYVNFAFVDTADEAYK